jgi:hypothetical protein
VEKTNIDAAAEMKKPTEMSEADLKEYYKKTTDQFLEEVRKTCYAMIDGKHVCESPVALVNEAMGYIDQFYKDSKKDEKQRTKTFE